MSSYLQRLWNGDAAFGAYLRTSARRDPDHSDTSIFRFVSKQPEESTPALVTNVFSHYATRQRTNIEILDCDQREARHELATQHVCMIPANVANTLVRSSYKLTSFLPPP